MPTVVNKRSDEFTADVMPETMRKTGLGNLKVGDEVNLDALRLSDRFGGHIVSGHIECTGVIVDKTQEDNVIWLTIEATREVLKYIVEKNQWH